VQPDRYASRVLTWVAEVFVESARVVGVRATALITVALRLPS
jgi:hypothetical protein